MDTQVFELLKSCEGKKLELSYYDKEGECWVLIFAEGPALLIDSVEEIRDIKAFTQKTLAEELSSAQTILRLRDLMSDKPVIPEDIENQLETVLEQSSEPDPVCAPAPVDVKPKDTPEDQPEPVALPEVADEPTPSA